MRVSRAISFDEYWKEYPAKRPMFSSAEKSLGDNIYEPLPAAGGYKQHRSGHSQHDEETGRPIDREDKGAMEHDLSGKRVLIAESFVYYGAKALKLPEYWRARLAAGRGHIRLDDENIVREWSAYMKGKLKGKRGNPSHIPEWHQSFFMEKMVRGKQGHSCRPSRRRVGACTP